MTPYRRARALTDAFLDGAKARGWHEEYGIDDKDAFDGVLALLEAQGTFDAGECKAARAGWRRAERKRDRKRAKLRLSMPPLTPAMIDSVFNQNHLAKYLDERFAPAPSFNVIRSRNG